MKYIKKFNSQAEYLAYIEGDDVAKPNVSYINMGGVFYHPFIPMSYIIVDQTLTDPVAIISGEVNGLGVQLIRQNSHRYLAKNTSEGVMTICQLDDNDSTKYADGTAADLTGGEGEVFMKLPRFAYKAEEIDTDKWKVSFYFGDAPDASWRQYEGNELIGAYEAGYVNETLRCYSGIAPTTYKSFNTYKSLASNRGSGFSLVKLKHQNLIAFLYYAMYGNTNCQAVVGAGMATSAKITGQTNTLGMNDTVAGVNGEAQSINFWGLENWWGDISEFLDNIQYVDNSVLQITEDDGTMREVAKTSSGYTSKMVIGEHLDVIAKNTSGSTTTGFCDRFVLNANSVALYRSGSKNYADGGVAYFWNTNTTSGSDTIGARIAFKGELVEEKDASIFKTLATI